MLNYWCWTGCTFYLIKYTLQFYDCCIHVCWIEITVTIVWISKISLNYESIMYGFKKSGYAFKCFDLDILRRKNDINRIIVIDDIDKRLHGR